MHGKLQHKIIFRNEMDSCEEHLLCKAILFLYQVSVNFDLMILNIPE